MKEGKTLRIWDYLQHILQAIERIETPTKGVDQAVFLRSPMMLDAVVRNIEIIGEASNNILSLDRAFQKSHPDL